MHRIVRLAAERFLRPIGALLILAVLIGPLASVHPAPAAAQDEPPDELAERWSYEGSDFFENNPAASGGVVFATTADSLVHAVDAETGQALWQAETGYTTRPYMHLADGVLYTLSADDATLTALDISPEGGEERWSVELPGPLEALQTPVTADGMILVLVDLGGSETGELLALSTEDGSEQWRFDVSEFIYGAGLLYADGVVVVGMEEGLTGLDAATGDELWQIDLDPTTVRLLAGEGAVFGAVRESDELFALDPASGDELWTVTSPESANLPLTSGDGLFFVDHPLDVDGERVRGILALDAETGEEQYTIASVVGELYAGVAQDGLLYLAGDETVGQTGALEVYDSDDGTLLARSAINAVGVGVDPETGVIFATTRGDDGDLLRAYEPVMSEGTSSSGEEGEGEGGDAPLDIAAMALTPWDLADAGLDNYGHGFSEMVFIDAFSATIAENREMPVDEVRELLEEAGFIRAYYVYFYSPADNEDVSQVVISYVFEFADAEGAADAWDFLEDESDRDDAEDLDGFDDFGDASEATLHTGEDEATGDPYAQIDASALTGNLHAGVGVVDWSGEQPEEDLVAELIEYTLEGAEAGLDAEQPALSNQIIRPAGDAADGYAGYRDAYLLRDGEAIWFTGETPEIADEQLDLSDAAGLTENYLVWTRLASWSDEPVESVWYYLQLYRFENDDAAADWLADREEGVVDDTAFTDLDVDDAGAGDAGFTYAGQAVETGGFNRGATIQVGELIFTVDLSGPVMPTEDVITALLNAQLDCLEDEGCIDPIAYPSELADYLDEAEGGSGAGPDDEETPEPEETEQADGGPVIYEGELYPFSVQYNANNWEMLPEDDPADDDEEWVQFTNDDSTVWMVATQEFAADELGDCVEHFLVALGWEDGWELEPLDELTEDDDRAFASYTMVDVLFGMYGYLSVECRPIDSDTVLMITHFAGTENEGDIPEEQIALVDDLKDGIVVNDAG